MDSKPEAGDAPKWLALGGVVVGFVVLTGVTGDTECAVDGSCEFGIPLRWMAAGPVFELVGAFVIDLALFLSLVPALLAVRRTRSKLALAWLVLVGAMLSLFTIANWSGALGLRIFLHSLL